MNKCLIYNIRSDFRGVGRLAYLYNFILCNYLYVFFKGKSMKLLNVTPANTRDEQGRERFFQYNIKDHMFTEARKNMSNEARVISELTEPLKQARVLI